MVAPIPKELIEKWKSKTATKAERDFEMDLWTEDSANRIFLKELIERMEKSDRKSTRLNSSHTS